MPLVSVLEFFLQEASFLIPVTSENTLLLKFLLTMVHHFIQTVKGRLPRQVHVIPRKMIHLSPKWLISIWVRITSGLFQVSILATMALVTVPIAIRRVAALLGYLQSLMGAADPNPSDWKAFLGNNYCFVPLD